jgi:hypothetical protein
MICIARPELRSLEQFAINLMHFLHQLNANNAIDKDKRQV